MKQKFLSILLTIVMVCSLTPISTLASQANDFPDMPLEGHWAYNALSAALENGLMQGSDGKLMPGNNLTRAEMATMISKAFGAKAEASIVGYSDVSAEEWYATWTARAIKMKAMTGDGNGKMRPNDQITRQECFLVINNVLKLAAAKESTLDKFSDASDVAEWARPGVAAMVQAGYISGSDGKLNPETNITRAEFAQVMYSVIKTYIKADGVTSVADGNVMVNVPNITLKGLTIKGDLIVGDGVGSGDLTLDNVKVSGRLVVRGGGENSILLKNGSSVGSAMVCKADDGGVRIRSEEGCSIDVVNINDGMDNIILEGTFNQVVVNTNTTVVLNSATVTGLTIKAEKANVTLDGTSNVSVVQIDKTAKNTELKVNKDAKVATLNSAAENVIVKGEGTVTSATVSGNNTAINIVGTVITVVEGTTGTTQNGEEVKTDTATVPPVVEGNNSGGGGGGGNTGGNNSSGNNGENPSSAKITVNTTAALIAALGNSQYNEITIAETTGGGANYKGVEITIDAGKNLSLAAGRKLILGSDANGNPVVMNIAEGASLTIGGTLQNGGYIDNYGTLTINGRLENNALAVLVNRGTVTVGIAAVTTNSLGYIANIGTITGSLTGAKTYTPIENFENLDGKPVFLTKNLQPAGEVMLSEGEDLFIPRNVSLEVFRYFWINSNAVVAGRLGSGYDNHTPVQAGSIPAQGYLIISEGATVNLIAGGHLTADSSYLINSGTINILNGAMMINEAEDWDFRTYFENSGTINLNRGLLRIFSAYVYAVNSGTINISAIGVFDDMNGINNSGDGKIIQYYNIVATETALRSALQRGEAVAMKGNFAITQNLNVARPALIVPDSTVTINKSVAVTVAKGGEMIIDKSGKLINNGAITAQATVGVLGTLENSGTINTYRSLGVVDSGKVINKSGGVLNLYASDEMNDISAFLWGGKLENQAGGTVNNLGNVNTWLGYSDTSNDPSLPEIFNAGTFNNGPVTGDSDEDDGDSLHAGMLFDAGGTLTNTGNFANNGYLGLYGVDITQSGGTFTNYRFNSVSIYGGSLTISGGMFNNNGNMNIKDGYNEDGNNSICQIDIAPDTFIDISGRINYSAIANGNTSLIAAESAQKAKIAEHQTKYGCAHWNMDDFCAGLGLYEELDISGDINFDESYELGAFYTYNLFSYWDEELNDGLGGRVPYVLTVDTDATLTVNQETTLNTNSGKIVVNGTLVTAAGIDDQPVKCGTVEISSYGAFDGTDGTVTNDGEFRIIYEDGYNESEYGTVGREPNSLYGLPLNAKHVAIVRSEDALSMANDMDCITDIEIHDSITLTSDLIIKKNMLIEYFGSLMVPKDITLEFEGVHVENDGNIGILGTMIVGDGTTFFNNGDVEVGGIDDSDSGSLNINEGGIIISANQITTYKNGIITVQPNAAIRVIAGLIINHGTLITMAGSEDAEGGLILCDSGGLLNEFFDDNDNLIDHGNIKNYGTIDVTNGWADVNEDEDWFEGNPIIRQEEPVSHDTDF